MLHLLTFPERDIHTLAQKWLKIHCAIFKLYPPLSIANLAAVNGSNMTRGRPERCKIQITLVTTSVKCDMGTCLFRNSISITRHTVNVLEIVKAVKVQMKLVIGEIFWNYSSTDRVENRDPIHGCNRITGGAINCNIMEGYDLKWRGISNMSRWTLKIPCVHKNGKTGKEDWEKYAIETIQPSGETVFKIFYRISPGLCRLWVHFFVEEPTLRCTGMALMWQFSCRYKKGILLWFFVLNPS